MPLTGGSFARAVKGETDGYLLTQHSCLQASRQHDLLYRLLGGDPKTPEAETR